jgi:hypothetical protein
VGIFRKDGERGTTEGSVHESKGQTTAISKCTRRDHHIRLTRRRYLQRHAGRYGRADDRSVDALSKSSLSRRRAPLLPFLEPSLFGGLFHSCFQPYRVYQRWNGTIFPLQSLHKKLGGGGEMLEREACHPPSLSLPPFELWG